MEERPLFSHKIYSQNYLSYVRSISGKEPVITSSVSYENWWGKLTNRDLEKELNSKLTSFNLKKQLNPPLDGFIIHEKSDFFRRDLNYPLISKQLFGMSGRGHHILKKDEDINKIRNFPVLIEPLKKRIWDFSAYVEMNQQIIFYQNFVDEKFQYKGTLIRDYLNPQLENLSFFDLIDCEEWIIYRKNIDQIYNFYNSFKLDQGFSIDSFIYEENDEKLIYPLCEVNYRKTMGYICFLMARRYAHKHPWCLLFMVRNKNIIFEEIQNQIKNINSVIILSPENARFHLFFLHALNENEGLLLLEKINKLLPGESKFSINL